MITLIPVLVALGAAIDPQVPQIPVSVSQKPVIVALAEYEKLDEQPKEQTPTEIKLFLKHAGVSFWEFPDDDFVIIVSKKIAPIEDFLATAKWADSVRNSGQTAFSHNTPEGQQLFDTLSKRQSMEGCQVAPSQNFMAIGATFSIKDPSGTL